MALNFHQLHIFYAVAEKGSFSAAAQRLHMTQPAVTMQIQALEEHFSAKLFHRSTKKVILTDVGETLLPFAERAIALIRETEREMVRYTEALEGRMHLGASLTIGEYILPRLLGPFSREYPHVRVSMKVMNSSQIVEEMMNHQLEFGLLEAPVHHPDLVAEPVLSDELKLIIPSGHPLLAVTELTMEEICQYPFVLREKGSGTRRVMEEAMLAAHCDPGKMQIAMELGSTGAIKSAVEAGLGLSIISQSSIKHEVALGLLHARSIKDLVFQRSFYAVYPKSALLPMPAVTFLTFLKEHDLGKYLSIEHDGSNNSH